MEALPQIVVWVISVFDLRQLGHEVRPLDQAAIRHADFETLKTLSLPKSTIGRRRSLLETARIDPIWVLGIRNGFRHPLRLFAMFEHLRTLSGP